MNPAAHRPFATVGRMAVPLLAAFAAAVPLRPAPPVGNLFTIDARVAPAAPETGYFQMGSAAAARSPAGQVLALDSRQLTLDGRPWLPVMGEFHFSRYPAEFWEEEILKMKAGGVQIVSTYVFWIHHEEEEGRFDWSGRRDLRRFVELCGRHGLYVWVRLGPWAHGEARNGGLPDWLLARGPVRVNEPAYLAQVERFYGEIGRQLHGLLWRDGGPVIGVQLENEYNNRAPNGGAAHIALLKELALKAGFDVPVYTVTGWDNTVYPPRIVTPVFGGYSDEPWSGRRDELPPDTQGVYQFAPAGGNSGILQGVTAPPADVDFRHYPRFTAELGAGLQLTYHRRVIVEPGDIPPLTLTALGAGANLLGYYMYHGGTNPDGRGPLQESQATGYPNDVPVKSYDFQAPLREFGQMNGSFRRLKVIHRFLADFGAILAPMTRSLPDLVPADMKDTTTLRVAARTEGEHGFLFFNNYIPRHPMPAQAGVQVRLRLPAGDIVVPRAPVAVPAQTSFFWPVNLDLDGATLTYATVQPLARLATDGGDCYFFVACAGLTPEFAFATPTVAELSARRGRVSRDETHTYVTGGEPATDTAVEIRTRTGKTVKLVLLSAGQAENAWKVTLGGRERLLLTPADLFSDGATVHLRGRSPGAFVFSIFPEIEGPLAASAPCAKTGTDGLFAAYRATVAVQELAVGVEKLRDAAPAAPVKMGPPAAWRHGSVAQAPDDADFTRAAAWRLTVPADALSGVSNVFLSIRYAGDVGRLYAGSRLLDDNFYNGTAWEIGLRQMAADGAGGEFRLEILPLRQDAPIYLPRRAWPDFHGQGEVAGLLSVQACPEYEVTLTAPPGQP